MGLKAQYDIERAVDEIGAAEQDHPDRAVRPHSKGVTL
jgi:hypothetical protein